VKKASPKHPSLGKDALFEPNHSIIVVVVKNGFSVVSARTGLMLLALRIYLLICVNCQTCEEKGNND